MFSNEFYPTPVHVLDMMDINCEKKIVLEPQAGKGDIVDYLYAHGAAKVLACELHPDLQKIAASKAQLIAGDFFTVTSEQISHVNMIVMNPPFSNADKHILHAWKIAPEGCEIISLCNWNTIGDWDRDYRTYSSQVEKLIKNSGFASDIGNCFDTAERKTNVKVGLLHLFKPITSNNFSFDGFFIDEDPNPEGNGLLPYNEIQSIVNCYISAVKGWDEFDIIRSKMNDAVKLLNYAEYGGGVVFKQGHDTYISNKSEFAIDLQKHCWSKVFNKLQVDKYVTKGVMEDLNKFIALRSMYPFTMKNIYRMIEIIIGTREHTMKRAIIEAIDNFTKHTHENRFNVEGWKTNEGHMLNRKFISGWICEPNYSRGLGIKEYNGNFQYMKDLTKALAFLTGIDYNTIPDIRKSSCPVDEKGDIKLDDRDKMIQFDQFESNKWYSWGFFDFKLFKKGTGHFKFKDYKVWELINREYAKAKGQVLPEKRWRE